MEVIYSLWLTAIMREIAKLSHKTIALMLFLQLTATFMIHITTLVHLITNKVSP